MSSPRRRYGDPETRERILRAAWTLIEDRGAEARLADVAARGNVSRQALYLHFGDRAGLLLSLVEFMDETLGLEELVGHVLAAPTGVEMLERTIELYVTMAPPIDRVAQVLETAQHEDPALAAAWRNRMDNRRRVHRMIVQRISDEGQLARGWSVDAAADLFYAITMPGVWRELTTELGWTTDDYRRHLTRLLQRALLDDGSKGRARPRRAQPDP